MMVLFSLLGLLMLGMVPMSWAQSAPQLKIETPTYTYDRSTNTYTYENATITWGKLKLEAGKIEYNQVDQFIKATDFVRYSDERMFVTADSFELNLVTQTGVMYNAVVLDNETNAYFTAKQVEKVGEVHFIARDCTLTTCPPLDPAWTIKGTEVDYEGENFSSAESATLYVKDYPVFYFPYLIWPTVQKRKSGFLAPSYALYSSNSRDLQKFNLGYRVGIPYFWAIDREQDLTITSDFIQNRGIGTGFDYQYAFRKDLRGEIKFYHIREREHPFSLTNYERDPEYEAGRLDPEEIDSADLVPPRFKLVINHNQSLGSRTRMIMAGQLYSDSQFQREYDRIREPNPNYNQQLNLNLSRQFQKGDTSLSIQRELVYEELALLNRNLLETRVQRLPEFTFHYADSPWDFPISLNSKGVITRFHRDEGFSGYRTLFTPSVEYRLTFFEYFNFISELGSRYSFYNVHNPGAAVNFADGEEALKEREESHFRYEIGLFDAEVNTSFNRVFTTEDAVFSRFKHIFTPRMLYESIADTKQEKTKNVLFPNEVASIDEEVDYFDSQDQLVGKKLVILRLDNVLLAKRRLLERRVKLTQRSLEELESVLDNSVLKDLDALLNEDYPSEMEFLAKLDEIFGDNLNFNQREIILNSLQKGLIQRQTDPSDVVREGPARVLARLNFIQRYNLLRRNENYDPKGPEIAEEEHESEAGDPLLPLILELELNPGPQFSVDFFLRYSYNEGRVVEIRSDFDVQVSPNNQATIGFHNNEFSYRTPEDIFHERTNTLKFKNVFEANDNWSFGFSGTLNLNISDESAFRRKLIDDALFINYHPDCYVISFNFQESAERTTSSSGELEETVERTLFVNVSLGEVLPLPEISETF